MRMSQHVTGQACRYKKLQRRENKGKTSPIWARAPAAFIGGALI